ncbi:MAG: ABC transporter ATP-binding protein [Halothermotrichaceae bacterium]
MKNNKLLESNNLTKEFIKGRGFSKTKLIAVNNANFTLEQGKSEIFTLVGESGSGKSTVAKLILGFEEPTSGEINYKNNNLSKMKNNNTMKFMKEVQPIFQDPFETFSPLKKVETYLYETEKNFNINKSKNDHTAIKESLQLVGLSLDEIEGKYPNEMSGGQLQRVSIARALITDPELIVADEPVSMIDASLRMSVLNLFKKLKKEKKVNIIYITHDLATAYYVSDKIVVMLRGEFVERGDVEKVFENPLHPYTQLLFESVPDPDPDKEWDTDIEFSDMETEEFSRQGCKFAGRCPHVKEKCKNISPSVIEAQGRKVKCFLYE